MKTTIKVPVGTEIVVEFEGQIDVMYVIENQIRKGNIAVTRIKGMPNTLNYDSRIIDNVLHIPLAVKVEACEWPEQRWCIYDQKSKRWYDRKSQGFVSTPTDDCAFDDAIDADIVAVRLSKRMQLPLSDFKIDLLK